MQNTARFSSRQSWSFSLVAIVALWAGQPGAAPAANDPTPRQIAAADRARLAAKQPRTRDELWYQQMSTPGLWAAGLERPLPGGDGESAGAESEPGFPFSPGVIGGADVIVHGLGDAGIQSETTIAADPTNTTLVAGFNDFRGFSLVPVSLSGWARSTDGGAHWTDMGQLPAVAGQVFGDPDVVWTIDTDPSTVALTPGFIYSSIFVRTSDGLQGMCISISTDDGATFGPPIQVTPAFIPGFAADKEFIDVNPVTGRLLMSWTNFGPGTSAIQTTYSDDGGLTWSVAAVVDPGPPGGFVQSSTPRFDPGTVNANSQAYVVWRRIDALGMRQIGCSRSTDGGATWSLPVGLDAAAFPAEDFLPGVDRVNTSPSLAVDHASGRVYAVYQRNNATGQGDIAFRTFVGDCATAAPTLLSSDPGNDRYQLYPWVTVDQGTHDVWASWLDQDPLDTGDLTEAMVTRSSDDGATWKPPTPLLDRPFRAGFGNDGNQPNLGDYNEAFAAAGTLHSLAGATSAAPPYDEGQCPAACTTFFTPDTYYDQREDSTEVAPLRLDEVTFTETGDFPNGNWDPNETVELSIPVESYVVNPAVGAAMQNGNAAFLTTSTPDVVIESDGALYPDIAVGASGANLTPFMVRLKSTFVPGTFVDFVLHMVTGGASIELLFRQPTGTPGPSTMLIDENFESVVPPAFPAGWTYSNGGGAPDDPWITQLGYKELATNVLFHDNDGTLEEFRRMFSPLVVVPTPAAGVHSYVTLDFDIRYTLEDEPSLDVQAYDGLTVRITDQTAGSTLRSVLAEAFAEQLLTGSDNHFPKHLVRDNTAPYFQDMSVWSGDSGGVQHVSMKLPGDGMAGRSVQLRFEFTEDSNGECTLAGLPPPCGVALDNILLRQIEVINGGPIFLDGFESGDTTEWSSAVPI